MEEIKKYLEEKKKDLYTKILMRGVTLSAIVFFSKRKSGEPLTNDGEIKKLIEEHKKVQELLSLFERTRKDQKRPEKKTVPELFEELRAEIEFDNKRNDSTRDVQHDPDYFFKSSFLLGADIFIHRAEKEYSKFKNY